VTSPPLSDSGTDAKLKPSLDIPPPKPPVNQAKQIAELVQEAVSRPTVLPVTYAIVENIGDRISRMSATKPATHAIIQPKIPQPDPNWKPSNVVVGQRRATSPTDTSTEMAIAVAPVQEETSNGVATTTEIATPPQTQPSSELDAPEENNLEAAVAPVHSESEPEQVVATNAEDTAVPQVLAAEPTQVEAALDSALNADAPTAMAEVEQASVDSASVAPVSNNGEALDKEREIQIQCPKCESTNLKKNGHYKGNQRYACKDCGRKFVLSDSVEEKAAEQTKTNGAEAAKVEVSPGNGDVSSKKKKASGGSGKKKAKGFGLP
jgi:predicted RNA-binding Zn-ribbon protein involved in translation (DUF1610 family)